MQYRSFRYLFRQAVESLPVKKRGGGSGVGIVSSKKSLLYPSEFTRVR